VLELAGVTKTFKQSGGATVQAVKATDLRVDHAETVALVGESGSGKSTLGRIALCLLRPDAGRVLLRGQDMTGLAGRALREARTVMQPIFQDPTSSFNPRRTVRTLLAQALPHIEPAAREARSLDLLDRTGLSPGREYLDRLPHELSGGQRQRLALARAIAMDPALIVADEPLSGADVSIRGQLLNLLLDLQRERGVAYLMITHDISIARAFADRVAVMARGEIVEHGPARDVLADPQHPYTQRLVAAVPTIGVGAGRHRPSGPPRS
jgi:ABC-type glutathione transport system ATPase component